MSQDEVTEKLIAHADGAGKHRLPEISDGEIDQDPVQRVAEFLELGCGHQHETVGDDWQDDHDEHPACGHVVNPSRGDVVIGALEWIWEIE